MHEMMTRRNIFLLGLQAKVDYADLLLGAATARAELAASTGAFR